ncbi:hypothetical protein B5M42_001305 [Paenibacillus athensensis]|uniref:Uncharacterized protein n=1 Tax=Paenibacillus athensensis TaxID=1967502 RepID=A0A4Y8QC24_9BACL|nr:hypothetical protein [Paenibacillus athensensis]MCD1257474.1 hypothetical protein [Paenibacillus athensensis]
MMPILLLLTLAVVFGGLGIYKQWEAGALAQTAAERLAYAWNSSAKDLLAGRFDPAVSDGLYWRWTDDLADDPFGRSLGTALTLQMELPAATLPTPMALPAAKLARAAMLVAPAGMAGNVLYRNAGLQQRTVVVSLHTRFPLSKNIDQLVGRNDLSGQGTAHVVDPVELIRLIDMNRTYVPQLPASLTLEAAKRLWVEPGKSLADETPFIRSEAQAAAYLRKLVAGEQRVLTVSGDQRRVADAFDAQAGIAHMAFYTFSEKQLRSVQLVKDASLLQSGQAINGIVWHFFHPVQLPSAALRRDLAAVGIAVVIHP